jgi:hypothetical protein
VHEKLNSTTPRPIDMDLVFFNKREEKNIKNGNKLEAHKKTEQTHNCRSPNQITPAKPIFSNHKPAPRW